MSPQIPKRRPDGKPEGHCQSRHALKILSSFSPARIFVLDRFARYPLNCRRLPNNPSRDALHPLFRNHTYALVFDAIKSALRYTSEVLGAAGMECGRMVGVAGHLFGEPGNVADDFGHVGRTHLDSTEALRRAGGKRAESIGAFRHVSGEPAGAAGVLVRVFGEPGSLAEDFGHLFGKPG